MKDVFAEHFASKGFLKGSSAAPAALQYSPTQETQQPQPLAEK